MPKVKYVQRVKWRGEIHLYFRKGDYREGPLESPDPPEGHEEGSPLQLEVQDILDRLEGIKVAQKPKEGTVGGLLRRYNRDAGPDGFLALARSTQAEYQRLIDELIEDCGEILLTEVTKAWVRDMRDAWAIRGYKVANDRLSVLANALGPAIEDDRIEIDPFAKLKRAKRPADAGETNPAWTDEEVAAGIGEALRRKKPGLARAIALGRWGGFRRGTICNIPRTARIEGFNDQGGKERRLYWITEKRQVLCNKREDPRLTDLIAKTPSNAWTLAYNADGGQWKARQLNQAVTRLMTALAKQGKARAALDDKGEIFCPLTIHGLRHARGVEIAEAGGSDAEIMAQLEHATDRQAKIYRRQADRKKLADAGQDRVDNVVKLRERRRLRQASTRPA